jgi:hypothetical protein
MRNIRIRAHIGRIAPTELEARPRKSSDRGALNRPPAFHGPRECNKRNAGVTNDTLGILVAQVHELEDALR